MSTPSRVEKSLEAPWAPARQVSSNTTELSSSTHPRMQELPEKQPSTPVGQNTKIECPNAPTKTSNISEELKIFLSLVTPLNLDDIFNTLSLEEYSTPPNVRQANKRRRVSLNETN